MSSATPVTAMLRAWGEGDKGALDRLVPVLHEELRRLAHRYMVRERDGQTLQTTALVNEAYIKLVDVADVGWHDRTHFFAVAARIMRRILVDSARARLAQKRGGEAVRVELDGVADEGVGASGDILALDHALEKLAEVDARKARVIEMRFFSGLSVKDTGAALGVSEQTVMRDWKMAKAWLLRELGGES